jgi:hypothetical protein
MDQDVVKTPIHHTVTGHPDTDRQQQRIARGSEPDQEDRRDGEDDPEEVVQFEFVVLGLVMRSMKDP